MRLAADGSVMACPKPSAERIPTSIGKPTDAAPAAVSADQPTTVWPMDRVRFQRSAR